LWAARALALMGEAARDATPSLVALLFDNRLPVRNRQSAVEALALIGAAHPDAIPAILRLLRFRPSPEVSAADATFLRYLAAECIFIAGPECGELAAPLLIRMIRDPRESEQVRRSAIVAIGSLQSRGALAANVLLEELVNGRAPALRDAAANALVKLGTAAVPAMLQCLRHADHEVRWRIAYNLRLLEPVPNHVAQNLVPLLEDPNPQVRICAAETVLEQFGKSDSVLSQAILLLQEEDRTIRIRANKLIVAMQPISAKHMDELQRLLTSEKKHAARSAQATLDQLTTDQLTTE
jgi:HEAT repeat protein